MTARQLHPRTRRRLATVLTGAVLATVGAGVFIAPGAEADAVPTAWTTVINKTSGKCVDARAAVATNGTALQQYTCNGTIAQQWQFQVTSNGNVRANSQINAAQSWDVANVSTADNGLVQLWAYGGGTNQQWTPISEGGGYYHFVNVNSGKCLDTPSASTADSVQLVQYTCNGTGAQSFSLGTPTTPPTTGPTATTPPANPSNPDLGPNVKIFDPSMSAASIQSTLNTVFNQQETNQFGNARYALLFKPGTYNVDANVGFFTQVAGLGLSPDAVTINGQVHAEADWWPDGSQNATQNFWRSAENLSITPPTGSNRWAVSQAAPFRRIHVRGNLILDDGGWSSGGFLADSKIDGQVQSGSQQQWISRNDQIGSWSGSNWNMVFAGVSGAPANSFPSPPYTTVNQTPVTREKPFLYVDSAGAEQVFVPALRSNTAGASWTSGTTAGSSLPISDFFIAKPGDSAATINAALAAGKNLLFTPGVFHVNDTIRVTRANTVVLGLGLATIIPDNGVTALSVADVDGVKVAGLLIDAGTTNSATLVQIGPAGSSADHSANPTSLSDVFIRIGGAAVGKATQSLVVNSNNLIGDHMWLWRADHGTGVGWTSNTAANGLIVNGNDVTMYGLFVEHYQQYQTIWNGERGRTYFYQNELPYDPPNQAAWMNGSTQGYAAYKVADAVNTHEAWGLGSYAFFNVNPAVVEAHSFEVPSKAGVKFHSMVTVSLGGTGTISHVINNTGAAANSGHQVTDLVSFP